MILGIGIDIIEISRIKKSIQSLNFINRIFTISEQEYCKRRKKEASRSFAARFAAKEAVSKAFGTGIGIGKWTDIEILNQENGKPIVRLNGKFLELEKSLNIKNIHISISHCKEYAIAQVILEV